MEYVSVAPPSGSVARTVWTEVEFSIVLVVVALVNVGASLTLVTVMVRFCVTVFMPSFT